MSDFHASELADVRTWRERLKLVPTIPETVAHFVGFSHLMVALEFLWPTFIEVRGCVLLPWNYSENDFEEWWTHFNGDRDQIEHMVNHTHLHNLFSTTDVTETGMRHLGKMLALLWAAALADQFPERKFNVVLWEDPDGFDPTIYIEPLD